MFSNTFFVVLASAVIATATQTLSYPPPKPTAEPVSQCNTGDAQCCNQVFKADNPAVTAVLGLVDVVVSSLDALVGLGCTSILGGGGCKAQAVCCANNNFNGVVAIGCTPISIL